MSDNLRNWLHNIKANQNSSRKKMEKNESLQKEKQEQ